MRMKKLLLGLLITTSLVGTGIGAQYKIPSAKTTIKAEAAEKGVTVYFKCESGTPNIYYWNSNPENLEVEFPGKKMELDSSQAGGNWYKATFSDVTKINMLFSVNGVQTADLTRKTGTWWYKDNKWYNKNPDDQGSGSTTGEKLGGDLRDDSIYFVMTARFYDGDTSNNVHCWDDKKAKNPDSDPAWRGDFQGLIDKLDYIKAMGFSAIWITPVVENASGYDYHGYHALNFMKVDPRLESQGATYQDLIDAAHAKGLKIIQDVVFNHTGNFGESNLFPMFEKDESNLGSVDCMQEVANSGLPSNYNSLNDDAKYQARLSLMKEDANDKNNIYHHEKSLQWESYLEQTGQIAGDCVDLNTENPEVSKYLVDAYTKYINMGVDGFRIDTVKHISRLTWNNDLLPQLQAAGGEDFTMFGEVCTRVRSVWNRDIPALSAPFFTWKETESYPWGDRVTNEASTAKHYQDHSNLNNEPTSTNAFLNGNTYHTPDRSQFSGMNVIDFPMHWAFRNAYDAFNTALGGDQYYNDATWNVTYVDSHDYAPDGAPENQRFAGDQDTWAENLNLMFTFRGIPCIYYGSEIEFQKGKPIDVGPNAPLSETGRAYFGDHIEGSVDVTDYGEYSNATGTMAETLNYPLAKHIQRLNLIRRAVPALRKGQYSTEGVSGGMAFKRRYTADGEDSFVCVAISGSATFTGIPAGTYTEAITGKTIQCNGTLTTDSVGKGNMRVYVLNGPGKIGEDGTYLK